MILLWLLGTLSATAQVNVTDFGAVGDGVTDNSAAFAAAIAQAEATGQDLYVPQGTFAYGDLIAIRNIKITGAGRDSVLKSLNPLRQAIFVYGEGAGVTGLRLTGAVAPTRQANWESTRITVFGANNFEISNVVIEGASAAGIQLAQGATHGVIRGNRISDTLSDSIHITDGAAHILVEDNRIRRAGDDGIAVVSYQGERTVRDVVARRNVVRANLWGRQMSVVGGRNVRYSDNVLSGNRANFACMYVAQEDSFATKSAHNVKIRRNSMSNCGGTDTGHGAVMIFSEGTTGNTNILVSRNDIKAGDATGIREVGELNSGVVLEQNRITTEGTQYDVGSERVIVTPHDKGPVGPRKEKRAKKEKKEKKEKKKKRKKKNAPSEP